MQGNFKKTLSIFLALILALGLLATPAMAAAPAGNPAASEISLSASQATEAPTEAAAESASTRSPATQTTASADALYEAQTPTPPTVALPLTVAWPPTAAPQSAATQAAPSGGLTAVPTASTVLVNGESISFDAYNIGGSNYFKLRDIAYTLSGTIKRFHVGWDAENNAISLISGRPYIPNGGEMSRGSAGAQTPAPTRSTIYLNGREVQLTAYNINGSNYFKLRDIGLALNFAVDWDGSRNTIVVDTSRRYTDDDGAFSYSDGYFGAAQGSAKFLEGRSVLVSIFASGETSWSAADISAAAQNLALATSWIVSEGSRYGADVELISDFNAHPDLMYNMAFDGPVYVHVDERTEEDDQLCAETNRSVYDFIEDNVDYLALADKYETDSIGYVVFYKDTDGRSYFLTYEAETIHINERYHEKTMILGQSYKEPSVIAHEILHLFGAADLYVANANHGVSSSLVEYSESNYRDDIMRSGRSYDSAGDLMYNAIQQSIKVTDITAYLLCWVDDTSVLTQFPEFARAVPAAFVGKFFEFNGFHEWVYLSGSTYSGNWLHGQMSGQGTFTWPAGDVYTGGFENGKLHGQGTYTWTNGDVYTGGWADDVRSGHGVLTYVDGRVYDGNYENGVKSGQGTFTWPSGSVYTGSFENDAINGQGTYTWPDGAVYTGDWANGVKSGQGTYTWANGNVYTGSWANDVRSGQGTLTWTNGNVYTGSWANDVRSGQGTFTWANGDVYTGSWANDVRSGHGVLTFADGTVQEGAWADGSFVG